MFLLSTRLPGGGRGGGEREEEEVLGVFFCKRERSLRSGGSHDVDLITWEDDEEGYI